MILKKIKNSTISNSCRFEPFIIGIMSDIEGTYKFFHSLTYLRSFLMAPERLVPDLGRKSRVDDSVTWLKI